MTGCDFGQVSAPLNYPFTICLKGLVLSGNVGRVSLEIFLGLGRSSGLWGVSWTRLEFLSLPS